ncbi:MAG: glycerol-3-phosphate 1-O-acyltransferase PlsY [Chroococcidiopsidaceae cyanobacterium CP_BM_RX_35]|nr:glycerol-3-phosphate 1-O-acyltransferase PlsY [Chroococcidiopsidaceae cyanobacterium CP_BM_RX_35]
MVTWLILSGAIWLTAYLWGSIPTGYLAGRLLQGIDLREHGSGSTGATNVLRTLGKGPALLVLLIDTLKGVLAIAGGNWALAFAADRYLIPAAVQPDWYPWVLAVAGLAALIGHSKSIWLGFTGGKSVGTSLGVLLAMCWQVGLGTLLVFSVVLALSRTVSLGSLAGAVVVSILMLLLHQPLPYQLFAVAGGLYVIWRHQSNLQRIVAGTEPRIGAPLAESS